MKIKRLTILYVFFIYEGQLIIGDLEDADEILQILRS